MVTQGTEDTGDAHAGLDDVLRALARRWRLVLLVAVPVFLGITGYTSTLPTTWTSTAKLGFAQHPGTGVGADTVALLVPGYVAYLTSPTVEGAVGAQYGVDAATLDRSVNVAVPPATATISIRATASSPALAAELANGLAQSAVSHAATDQILTVNIEAQAVPPVAPSGPRRRLIDVFGLLGALLLGLLVAGVVERGFPRVRSRQDVTSAVGWEVLGEIPLTSALRTLGGEALDDALVGVAVRTLRLHLGADPQGSGTVILGVCSAERREGRSTVTALLAHAFARLDLRVLIVDADVTRCHLTKEYALDLPPIGLDGQDLIGVLEERVDWTAAVRGTGVPNLSLLPCSPADGVSDLLTRRMGSLLGALRKGTGPRSGPDMTPVGWPATGTSPPETTSNGYDVVLVDTPALRSRDEAVLLAALVDGVLLVSQHGGRVLGLRTAVAALHNAGAQVQGIVLNRVPKRSVPMGAG